MKQLRLNIKNGVVELTHGSGGRAMHQLIDQLFIAAFNNEWLAQGNDSACFTLPPGKVVMATDGHVISPLIFPGGDIGSLSINGTINDIAMSGAQPIYMSASFILEEGFPLNDLKHIVDTMAATAKQAGVPIITGDTKVVEKGKGDGVFITTTGVGVVPEGVMLSCNQAKPGDHVLISGHMGDHGVAVMALRESLSFKTRLKSDTCALHGLVAAMVEVIPTLRCLRDPTRGGVATTLNEWAGQSRVGFHIQETAIPVREEVRGACELLGLDPLYVANEGILLAICPPAESDKLLQTMQNHHLGQDAAIIGEVVEDPRHFVQLTTHFGGQRIVDWLVGEQLPRIC